MAKVTWLTEDPSWILRKPVLLKAPDFAWVGSRLRQG
jgi:hypothetical protein